MTGMDGVTAGRLLVREHPLVRVLILTAYPGALDRERLRRDGIAGLLIKDQPAAEIAAAIRLPQAS